MKRAQIIVVAIAVSAAGLAALIANSFIGETKVIETVRNNYDTVDVLVAKFDIGLGDSVQAKDLRWQKWPADAATSGYITRRTRPDAMKMLSGSLARAPFLANEPIKEQKLIKASEGGVMAAILPAGMRAISTRISEESAAGGFILPNDRVDVILTRRLRSGGGRREQHVTDTLFTNVRIMAIGQVIEMKDGEKVVRGNTATLELSPRQSETLALARAMGDISLVLRSLSDYRPKGKIGSNAQSALNNERGSSIGTLRYGDKSRAYGVN